MFKRNFIIIGLIALLIIVLAIGGYFYQVFTKEKTELQATNKKLEEDLQESKDTLTRFQNEVTVLSNDLAEARTRTTMFANRVEEVNFTLDRLNQLAKLDPQLLQKYSKIYFLNENYKPAELTRIDTKYLFTKTNPLEIHDRVWPFLQNLLDAIQAENLPLQVASAYRSFTTQTQLKSQYRVTYGAGTANSFSADQGYSEHQLGTAVDFTTPKVGGVLSGFERTDSYKWLQNNAYKYGFILSYPLNNGYYVFEPWHWRFVGLDLALKLHNENKKFYDLDQRDINTYLINIFNATTTISSSTP
jgi:D-alanyl-D-alanine carboxypeptidase